MKPGVAQKRVGVCQHGWMDRTLAGSLLVASPLLFDPNFFRSVVFLLQHDQDGALGVILNRPSEEPVVAHLPEWGMRSEDPAVVFVGGPVEPSVAIGIIRADVPTEPTALLGVGLVDLTADPGGSDNAPIRVFSGYAGWGSGQLEAELSEGAWMVVPASSEDLFSVVPDQLWSAVLRRQGGKLAMLATFPDDPSLN
jgi:putative transcriptional regulator